MIRILLLAITVLTTSLAWGEEFKTYHNKRFGYSIPYPSSAIEGTPDEEGAGTSFTTLGEEFSLQVNGGMIRERSLDDFWKDSLLHYGDSITYKVKKKDWYVVSGVRKGGGEYYYKVNVQGGKYAAFLIKYPHSRNKKYDPWVETINKGFKPFPNTGYKHGP